MPFRPTAELDGAFDCGAPYDWNIEIDQETVPSPPIKVRSQMRYVPFLTAALLTTPLVADEIDLTVTPSPVKTAATTPLTFNLERSTMQVGSLRFWGRVKNDTDKTFRFVRVVATARDEGGRQLGQTEAFVEPDILAPGASGYVNAAWIPCGGGTPKELEYSVRGNAE